MPNWNVSVANAVSLPLDDNSVDLVFCSPPYEAKRRYAELDFKLKGKEWVEWAAPRFLEHLRVSKGLVAWVVDGCTSKYRYSNVVERLMVRLDDEGVCLRRPCYYMRHGIPGSGGPDWFKSMLETVVCATKVQGPLPWSDNTACGHEPKWGVGGAMSNRNSDGRRINAEKCHRRHTKRVGDDMQIQTYKAPDLANPGNVITCDAGGGRMGHHLAHENEAPFPLRLAEFFVKSCCPPDGVVCDPFCGSGTTGHAAVVNDRNFVGFDLRQSQVDLTKRRLVDVYEKVAVA